MDETSTMVRITFSIEKDENGYPPGDNETMWTRPVADGYALDNIPMFARGISYGDIVDVDYVNSEMRFRSVVKYSGHSTVRLVMRDMSAREQVRADLKAMGCESEQSHFPRLIAVDIPPDVDIDAVRKYLKDGESGDVFGYEEATIWW